MMSFKFHSLALFGFVIPFALAACAEVDMKVAVNDRNPPTFALSGSGNLNFFLVMEVPPDNQTQTIQRESDRNIVLWKIHPELGDNKIHKMPAITYGKLPPGFVQDFPASGPPPKLVEGKIFEVGGTAYNANGGFIWIKLEGDTIREIPIPGSTPGDHPSARIQLRSNKL
jgi:hypothetical protein